MNVILMKLKSLYDLSGYN